MEKVNGLILVFSLFGVVNVLISCFRGDTYMVIAWTIVGIFLALNIEETSTSISEKKK